MERGGDIQLHNQPQKVSAKSFRKQKGQGQNEIQAEKEAERKNVIAYLKRFSGTSQDKTQKDEVKTDVPKTSSKTATYKALDNQICIQNKFPKTLLFIAEAKNGQREVKMIKENATLCVNANKNSGGTVGVFENEEALEGCSRLAKTGNTETLIAYASFDNCEWGE